MRFVNLAAAALAAAWTAAPVQASISYNFLSVGQASNFFPQQNQPTITPSTAYGRITIDPAAGASSFSYNATDLLGYVYDVNGSVAGDTLTVNYSRTLNHFTVTDKLMFGFVANFQTGFLQGTFPTAFAFNQVTGGSVNYFSSVCQPFCLSTQYNGPLNNLFATPSVGVSGVAAVVSSVPEPATWALMLLGFGAIGAALRRRVPGRYQAALST